MIPSGSYFFTGTDTGVGKTYAASQWIASQQTLGIQVVPMKPVAAGCYQTPAGLRNADAEKLISASQLDLPYERVNRYAFAPAIAPHIAAQENSVQIDLGALTDDFEWLRTRGDCVCVEGAGGWKVPLGPDITTADIPRTLNIEVVLVVGIRLGCLNHTLLSAEAIIADGCRLAGWVANFCDPEVQRGEQNCQSLIERIDAPLLCSLGYNKKAATA